LGRKKECNKFRIRDYCDIEWSLEKGGGRVLGTKGYTCEEMGRNRWQAGVAHMGVGRSKIKLTQVGQFLRKCSDKVKYWFERG